MGQKGIIVNTPENVIQSDAQDWASIFDSFLGGASGIAQYGKKLEIQKVSDNEVRLLDGLYSLQGHILTVDRDTFARLIIESGTLGMNRIDLVIVEYVKSVDLQKNDAFEFKVLRGKPKAQGTGNPEIPSLVVQDLQAGGSKSQEALYSISIVDDKITEMVKIAPHLENLGTLLEKTRENALNIVDDKAEVMRLNYPNEALVQGEIYNATLAIDTARDSMDIYLGRVRILRAGLYAVSLSLFLTVAATKQGDRIWVLITQGSRNLGQVIVMPPVGTTYMTVNIPPTIVDLFTGEIKTDVRLNGIATAVINGGTSPGASYLSVSKIGSRTKEANK